jgi:hypothetical protein
MLEMEKWREPLKIRKCSIRIALELRRMSDRRVEKSA